MHVRLVPNSAVELPRLATGSPSSRKLRPGYLISAVWRMLHACSRQPRRINHAQHDIQHFSISRTPRYPHNPHNSRNPRNPLWTHMYLLIHLPLPCWSRRFVVLGVLFGSRTHLTATSTNRLDLALILRHTAREPGQSSLRDQPPPQETRPKTDVDMGKIFPVT
jgi:hypothetical protein